MRMWKRRDRAFSYDETSDAFPLLFMCHDVDFTFVHPDGAPDANILFCAVLYSFLSLCITA